MALENLDPKILWLVIFVGLYWIYCLICGLKGAFRAKTAADYMIAGRRLGPWAFVLAATATSFSAWTFIGHAGAIYNQGFPYAYAGFYAITIPFTGMLFLKRQWLLGKHYGFVTPGEMFYAYFRSDLLRLLIVLIALVFAVPFLAIQLRAAGFLFEFLTHGQLSQWIAHWSDGQLHGIQGDIVVLTVVLVLYVIIGGLRAVADASIVQGLLMALGLVLLGLVAIFYVPHFGAGLAALSHVDPATGKAAFGQVTADGYSSYVAIPGVIGLVKDGPSASGGMWTGVMLLSSLVALMGIQSAPAFSMWGFASKSPGYFAPQQVWVSAFVFGLILLVFAVFQGVGGHFLGADSGFAAAHPTLVNAVLGTAPSGQVLPGAAGQTSALVPQLIALAGHLTPWLLGLLAVCALAALQSTSAAYMSTTGSILSRDLLRHFFIPNASDATQKFWAIIGVLVVVVAALYVATDNTGNMVLIGGLAIAYGLQLWPALIGACWWPFLTGPGVVLGLLAGLVGVTMTDTLGQPVFGLLGMQPLWGRWPLTIHSALWGLACNLIVAIVISVITQTRSGRSHRLTFHNFLREHAGLSNEKKAMVPLAWIIALAWFFFAIGPGAVIGNTLFGDPNAPATWLLGIPSIWVWQLLFWVLGVFMMWLLAYYMGLSTEPEVEVEVLVEDIPSHLQEALARQ